MKRPTDIAKAEHLLVIGAAILIPILAANLYLGREGPQPDKNCGSANRIVVKLRSTVYVVPASLQPTFGSWSSETEIRTLWDDGRTYYCLDDQTAVPQREISIKEPGQHPLKNWDSAMTGALRPVRIFSIETGGRIEPGPTSKDEVTGPEILGRPTVYRCWEGYYGPGFTCRYSGWTEDGAGVTVQMHPKPSDADRDRAIKAVEAIIRQLRGEHA